MKHPKIALKRTILAVALTILACYVFSDLHLRVVSDIIEHFR